MQKSRARDFEHRRGHVANISISDPAHHVTDAIAHMYGGENDWLSNNNASRPTFMITPPVDEGRKDAPYFDKRSPVMPPERSPDRSPSGDRYGTLQADSPTGRHGRSPSLGSLQGRSSPPQLTRTPSSDTAVQRFPLNDIDYESSPAAVAQELSNLQAIRRMSMSVDNADPDLPSFHHSLPSPPAPPSPGSDEDDAARLFWVPASLHPELAPKEFKTFVEERVELIRRSSGKSGSLSPGGAERSGGQGSLRRKKSRLSKTIDNAAGYEDGAELLERRRPQPNEHQRKTSETTLQELESLVNDRSYGIRTLTLETSALRDQGGDADDVEGLAIMSPNSPQPLKRSTRTNYRRGSLRKGERVPLSKRGAARLATGDMDDLSSMGPGPAFTDDETYPLERAQTEPATHAVGDERHSSDGFSGEQYHPGSSMNYVAEIQHRDREQQSPREERPPAAPFPVFQSRIASGGRTTASLPGYNGPQIVQRSGESMHSHSRQQSQSLGHGQALPERKSSHEVGRMNTIHTVPLERPQFNRSKGYHQQRTLDDMANLPSLMPGTNTRTDAVTFIPTFHEDKKVEKKQKERKDPGESSKKGGWSWFLGSDDKDKAKEKREKDEKEPKESKEPKKVKSKITKVPEKSQDTTRLDVLQTATEGVRGRESLVLDRDSIKIEDDRKKDGSRKIFGNDSKKEKDSSLFSSLFGGKQKKSDREATNKKPIISRGLSPEPQYKPLRADIDYNWTRFSILEERAIYRMAHIKLANPRRALYSQVLLSNFMYSYLAKVQQMHPQIQIPQYITQSLQQQQSHHQQQEQGEHEQRRSDDMQRPMEMDDLQSDEFAQWQRYQARHDHPSYDLDNGAYNSSFANQPQQYSSNYIDDYDEGDQHHQHQEAPWPAYEQHNGQAPYAYHQAQHWDERAQYSQQSQFDGTRPPERGAW